MYLQASVEGHSFDNVDCDVVSGTHHEVPEGLHPAPCQELARPSSMSHPAPVPGTEAKYNKNVTSHLKGAGVG